ncbi:NADPH-dependent FMN reductase [Novosphingobium sp.]|jgi:FMN reductase|uniref:NADPH-dependent FMN reductase n=1 Tax=Novosphingobium sp. TaxID=1874826 RepID=UPI001EC7ACFC|nr:NADPH-dependent FMN reductase [Novosphingobium sp.]MBK6802641.1 NAD(P)H-dependent oxidoreductase [Novosphingobium sp.]MBK9012506.1 NAD(P)H-dependent oxidoreductase [Novosphingobium sp.]
MELRLLALGGTPAPGSSTGKVLDWTARFAASLGARVDQFDADFLAQLPLYQTPAATGHSAAQRFVDCARQADGVLIASPGWHGSVSGSVKNALDYLEETARDERPYLDGRPVGLIATAYGWQAAVTTLNAMRTIVHALRGWPTPLGVAINCSQPLFAGGEIADPALAAQLKHLCRQVIDFAALARSRQPLAEEPK